MKKAILFLLAFVLVLSITACSDGRSFDSSDALLEEMEGMWLVRETNTYYIFRDGRVYKLGEYTIINRFKSHLDSLVKNRILDLSTLTYARAISAQGTPQFLGEPETITIEPKKGRIHIDKDGPQAERIQIKEDHVTVRDVETNGLYSLEKYSDTIDFSGEDFEALFQEAVDNYTISFSDFTYSASEYAQALKSAYPYPTRSDSFTISNDMMIFSEDGSQNSYVMYNPSGVLGQDYHLLISDDKGTRLDFLLYDYADVLLEKLPGALSSTEIVSLFTKNRKVYSDATVMDTTVNGYRYKISKSPYGLNTRIWITLPTSIKLKTIMEQP